MRAYSAHPKMLCHRTAQSAHQQSLSESPSLLPSQGTKRSPDAGEQSKVEAALGNTLVVIVTFALCGESPWFRYFPHFQLSVQHGYPNLNEQVRSLIGPAHLPLLRTPQTHDFIDRRFRDTAADWQANRSSRTPARRTRWVAPRPARVRA